MRRIRAKGHSPKPSAKRRTSRMFFFFLVVTTSIIGLISFIGFSSIHPPHAHAQTTQLYVSNSVDNTVTILNPTTGNTISIIPVGAAPRGIVFNGTNVYVANISSQDISVIDPNTNSVIKTISLSTGSPERLALSPDKKTLYASDNGTSVYIINTATNTVTNKLPGFSGASGMAVSLDGTRLYVANQNCCGGTSWVSVLDTTNYSTITTIPVGVQPVDIVITPDGTKAYVTNSNDAMQGPGNSVSVIDLSTNSVIQTISNLPTNPYSVVLNHAGTRAYVTSNNFFFGGGTQTATSFITVIDTGTNSVITQIPVGYVPDNVAISSDDSTAYSTNEFSNNVSVIDTATNTVKNTFNTGTHPWGVALIPVNNRPPSVGSVTITPNPVQINMSVTAITTFTDPDAGQTHTATVNYGDTSGSCNVTEPSGSTPGSVSCTRSAGYPAPNVYPVTIIVSDGIAQTTSAITYAAVFNPTPSSIFSAGEHYSNPSTANPNTSGTVTFGLTYKYQGGMPNANRPFTIDFNATNLHFNATSVSSFVVSNGMATIQGGGTLNGTSGYTFLVTGINGGGIRIQLIDPSNNVIYDTQPNAAITATPTTSVTGHVVVQ